MTINDYNFIKIVIKKHSRRKINYLVVFLLIYYKNIYFSNTSHS